MLTYPTCIWPTSIVSKQLERSMCHLARRYRPRPRPQQKGYSSHFSAHVYCPTVAHLSSCRALVQSDHRRCFLITLHTIVIKNGARHFGTWDRTVRHLGQDSSALRSKLSSGHFGTSADLSGPTKLVSKCPGSEVSVIQQLIYKDIIQRP